MVSYLTTVIAILYFFFDINYFLRLIFTFIWAKFIQKKTKLLDKTTIYSICTTQDLDFMSHMNNARYLRELDFSRYHYFLQTKMYFLLTNMGITAILGGLCTRYRRSIKFFMIYKITTKLIYWDEKSFYFEHRFINLQDNFIHTVILSKQTTIGMKMPLNEFIKKFEPEISLPEINSDLRLWLESMKHSSQKLRKKD
ncbi:protein THEM6-like [Vespa mandarinia]|uniref:protein THEM6-like n=1 Tax=Vespa mandarinia TaxID=7446 RepID=UPI00161A1CCF|nr:protein THEM6-like [Vespa mandarinia]